jgi:hypothetical protein
MRRRLTAHRRAASASWQASPVQVVQVDPRESTFEDLSPAYRVNLWRSLGTSGAFESTEFELTDADVDEVLEWARTSAGSDRAYVVYVVVQASNDRGLLRIAGADPTTP